MLQLCKRCPAREKCVHYWEEKKARWDAKIDKICPKKACTRMGYCKKAETSSMCDYMGLFKQVCEQTFHTVGQLLGKGHEQSIKVFVEPVSVPSKDKQEKQVQYYSPIDTNSLINSFNVFLAYNQQHVKLLEFK
jgi:hypothetical protein